MLNPKARMSPTPTNTEFLMTTPRLTSMLPRLLTELVLLLGLTPLLFLMAVPNMLLTLLTITTDMLLMLPTKELLCTQRRNLMHLLLHMHLHLRSSLCFVNIYETYLC